MSGKYSDCICKRCNRPYYYWEDKGLFNSRKFCPDCRVILKSKAIHGLPLEDISICKTKSPDKEWADKQVIDIVGYSADLTAKQQAAVNSFLKTGKVPKAKGNYYLAIKKLKAAGKALFKG
jgi:hypothetical protein